MSKVISIQPKEAWDLLQANPGAVLIDVRSSMEFLFVGHAKSSMSVPWIDEPNWTIDEHFVTHVRQLTLGRAMVTDSAPPIILICRSGRRSLEAGEKLVEDHFINIYNVEGGFEGDLNEEHHRSSISGWRHSDLPWEQC